jgi:hypothetical protein
MIAKNGAAYQLNWQMSLEKQIADGMWSLLYLIYDFSSLHQPASLMEVHRTTL